jgi:hypothetical protein
LFSPAANIADFSELFKDSEVGFLSPEGEEKIESDGVLN